MGTFRQKDDEAQLALLHPQLSAILRRGVESLPFDVFLVYGYRDVATQQSLYAIGRTVEKWRKPVTPLDGITNKSQHNYSPALAADVAPWSVLQNGKWTDTHLSDDQFQQIGLACETAAKALGIKDYRWGGRFKHNPDRPHHELNRKPAIAAYNASIADGNFPVT